MVIDSTRGLGFGGLEKEYPRGGRSGRWKKRPVGRVGGGKAGRRGRSSGRREGGRDQRKPGREITVLCLQKPESLMALGLLHRGLVCLAEFLVEDRAQRSGVGGEMLGRRMVGVRGQVRCSHGGSKRAGAMLTC